jgi:hypothetical protein
MNDLETITPKARFSTLGLEIADDLTFDEWRQFSPRLGDAALALGFAIGDWLIFGERFAAQRSLPGFEDMPAKVPHERYEQALVATRLDIGTLQNFAYVARNVPRSVRHELLSFEHHRAVARLDQSDQRQWIATTLAENEAGRRMSVRRLRRSIEAGRVLAAEELQSDPAAHGILNHIPFVNRLVGWWAQMRAAGWLRTATKEQRDALKRDLQPVANIISEL